MAHYVVLTNLTKKGVHDARDTIERADKFKEMAKNASVTVKDMYWTIGAFDVVAICEAPDDETMTALSLSVAARGYVHTQTLRAFNSSEMAKVIAKLT